MPTTISKLYGKNTHKDQVKASPKKGKNQTVAIDFATLTHLKNLALGYYSPVENFMGEKETLSVMRKMKFKKVHWTVPVLFGSALEKVELEDFDWLELTFEGEVCGHLEIKDLFVLKKEEYCQKVYQTTSTDHPGVKTFLNSSVKTFIGGRPYLHPAYVKKHKLVSVNEKRKKLARLKPTFAAFSTRNIPHIGHEYIQRLCLENHKTLGLLVITGAQVKDKFKPEFVKRFYEFFADRYYPKGRVLVDELYLPPIYAGPREAFLQATIVQNMGYQYFVVGRDHAGCGSFYDKYASQNIFKKCDSLNIQIIPIQEPSWCEACHQVTTPLTCPHTKELRSLNGTDVRRSLLQQEDVSLEKILRPEALSYLRECHEKESLFFT